MKGKMYYAARTAIKEPFEEISRLIQDCLPGITKGTLSEAERLQIKKQYESLNHGFPLIHGVLNLVTNNYVYLTDNAAYLDGDKDKMMELGLPYILEIFHPDERPVIAGEILPEVIRFLGRSHDQAKLTDARAAFTSRLRLRNGEYRWFVHQMSILETDINNAPLLALKLLMEIGGIKNNSALDLVLSLRDDNDGYRIVQEYTYPVQNDTLAAFSKRELQVLKLITEGKTSKQIAALLHISEHTVNNHRKNMLRKKEASSTPELVLGATAERLF